MTSWTTTPITGTFGLELSGGRLDDAVDAAWVRGLLDEHRVIVARDQHLSPAEQVSLARAFGEPTPAHPVVPGRPGTRDPRPRRRRRRSQRPLAHRCHVHAHPTGGVRPRERRDARVRRRHLLGRHTDGVRPVARVVARRVDGLEAVHRISPLAYWGEPFDTALDRADAQRLYDDAQQVPPVIHPVVRVHPTTGRRNLFVNPGFTTHVVGMSRIESDGLLALLYAHMFQPEFTMRHRWRAGDVVVWDNRTTAHYAIDDYGSATRRMRRVTVRGTTPVGPTGTESRIATDALVAVR
ncbi:MAG: TauD/TfdA family dioxygenase [Ilumatobacteraceae bacterium]